MSKVSLVIFTCESREHLMKATYDSFLARCNYAFDQIILAVDGHVDQSIISYINPDLVIYGYKRKGYVISIKNTIINIKSDYFFWLEDDWNFHTKVDIPCYIDLLEKNPSWSQIAYSKYGPLTEEFKVQKLADNLYENINGYSCNPGFNRTAFVKDGFYQMDSAKKKRDDLSEIGFENFLTSYASENGKKCVLIDPVDHTAISHEGYLESTPRNWHMISSLEKKTEEHLLIFPKPSLWRRLYMIVKLSKALISLSLRQLWNNEVYELCFRVITLDIVKKKNARTETDHNNSNG
ncbi:hypothetical protein JN11_02569 [Mucilaginibacter frigoritolerans]|uniref:Glycosyl transferase family 2 n=1 Tax=Mucilaginibacter frigoritolerans TaxID=652788 RepID=A0A562U075_9SPHI|nr:hypothetical protein [Mucilaginibacter frigoritolerans]TWI99252.1 hypothetical protein JN11_02569 [Mucilaginibacter frigoritolerans]